MRAPAPSQRGSALLLVVMLAAALSAAAAVTMEQVAGAARELGARRDAMCARFAALGALELGVPGADPDQVAATVDARVQHVAVRALRLRSGACVLEATARCGAARRSYRRSWSGTCRP